MISNAIRDSREFIIYILIILASFSVMMSLMTTGLSFEGIGSSMYMIATIRTVLGDPVLVGLETDYEVLFWIVWLLLVFIAQIILLNFIITVVGESYSKCSDQRVEHFLKVKLQLVVERESLMTGKDFARGDWFPNYILFKKNPQDDKEKDALDLIQEQLSQLKQE